MSTVNSSADPQALSFEQILEQLEQVVCTLEAGDVPLESALSTFEQGIALSRVGNQRLDDAERRIEQLLESGQTTALTDVANSDAPKPTRRRKKAATQRETAKESSNDE